MKRNKNVSRNAVKKSIKTNSEVAQTQYVVDKDYTEAFVNMGRFKE